MKKMQGMKSVILLSSSLIWFGCSTAPKGDIAGSSNPTDVIAAMETNINEGEAKGYGVLDYENFKKSKESLADAKDKLKDNDDQKDILDELRESKGYYEKAAANSQARKEKLQSVMDARDLALAAGVSNYPKLSEEWKETEEDTRDLAAKNATKIDRTDLKKLQGRYIDLELDAIKARYVGDADSIIMNAKEKKAEKKAPKTLKIAEVAYDTAVSKISINRNSPEMFNDEVTKANYAATRLSHVMDYVKDEKYSEVAAIELVNQKEKIGMLGSRVANQNNRIMKQGDQLEKQESELALTQGQLAFKEALDRASKQFKPSEADVYQQDDKLIIRLKSLNFATGKSTLPNNAAPLLNKIENVAEGLAAKSVIVQGHTDSVGSKELNQKLSEERAETVAKYLEKNGFTDAQIESEGFGDTKPLKNNQSAANRTQNRRIDIVITPSSI